MESLCRLVGFDERQSATPVSGKPLIYEGKLYSEEHDREGGFPSGERPGGQDEAGSYHQSTAYR